jgi:hypothetical protein
VKKFRAKNLYDTDPNGMRVCIGQLIEVEFWDKGKSIELLGREENLFTEKKQIQHDVTQNMASFLLDSSKRADERIQKLRNVTPVAVTGTAVEGEIIEDVNNDKDA